MTDDAKGAYIAAVIHCALISSAVAVVSWGRPENAWLIATLAVVAMVVLAITKAFEPSEQKGGAVMGWAERYVQFRVGVLILIGTVLFWSGYWIGAIVEAVN